MKEKILEILKNTDKKMTIEDIIKSLPEKDEKLIQSFLDELEKEYLVYKTNKNKYMLFSKNEYLRIGKLRTNKKGFGFLVNADFEEDLFIPEKDLNGAIDEDYVLVSVEKKNNSAKVIKIIKRELNNLVGEITFIKNKAYVTLDDGRTSLKILIKDSKVKDCVTGTKVKIEMTKERTNNSYIARIVKIIGHKDDPGVDIKSVALRYGFDEEFNEEVMSQTNNIATEVYESEYKGRTNLIDKVIFTIDGDDTKDIDDALSIEVHNDLYRLGVHIADVSYYVTENSLLDKEALKRGTSAYLADSVIPMLPHKLSNGICSLNPNVIRCAISCEMDIDNKGNVVDYKIFPSIIKSRIQMTYKKVNDILMNDIVDKEYEQYKDKILLMNKLAKIIRHNRDLKGNLDFDMKEAKVVTNENKEVIRIELRTRGDGERLIEDFMIAANETVASHIFNKELPFIYRTHEKPNPEKVLSFIASASLFGYSQEEVLSNFDPKSIQKILNSINELENKNILSSLLLRSMRKAMYTKENIGHFGLASECYTHFTSPIRRYPDLIVHRLLRKYVFYNEKNLKGIEDKLSYIAENSSLREQAAIEAEREVLDMKMAEYMSNHIGEVFTGTISGVMNFGFFVELDNLIEGLVHQSTLTDDEYSFDEKTHTISGHNHGKRYRLGDKVVVKLIKATKESGEIDFEIKGDEDGN